MSGLRISLPIACLLVAAVVPQAVAEPRYATSDSASEQRSEAYREGQRALDGQNWDDASTIFGKIAAGSGPETDAALYWKAYADWKRKLKKESLDGLRMLLATYPKSAWADDAKALEQNIRDGKGGRETADADDEELKLYALDGLMQREPEQAVPVLEKFLAGNSSLRAKERALFVLSQSDSPRAREILLRTAKSGQPIALRCEAVKTLGIAGEPEDLAALAAVAKDTSAPLEVREALIEAYLIAERTDELAGIAKSDPDPRIRAKAIDALGANDAPQALRQLLGTEKDPAIRAKLIEALGVAGDVDTLAKIARESPDPELRRKAIEGLAASDNPTTGAILKRLYGEFSGTEDKRRVVEALMVQDNAKALLELFRAEKDPTMKKIIFQQITVMDDPEATRAILDVLGQ